MAKHGGRRKGSGRKKGSKSKKTLARQEAKAIFLVRILENWNDLVTIKLNAALGVSYNDEGERIQVDPDLKALDDLIAYVAGKPAEILEIQGIGNQDGMKSSMEALDENIKAILENKHRPLTMYHAKIKDKKPKTKAMPKTTKRKTDQKIMDALPKEKPEEVSSLFDPKAVLSSE